MKLFCFPYAGASAMIYNSWKGLLKDEIILEPIELAGRGKRIREPLYNNISELINDVFQVIKNDLQFETYAFFGHSMGAIVAYELIEKIIDANYPLPKHVFFSGKKAPNICRKNEKKYHLLEGEEFKREIIELGGTNMDFFCHPELLDIFLPLLKRDLKLAETYTCYEPIKPFDFDITVFFGKSEDTLPEQCDAWKNHTKRICSIHYFNGGHFFINNNYNKVIEIINKTL